VVLLGWEDEELKVGELGAVLNVASEREKGFVATGDRRRDSLGYFFFVSPTALL
jgi:hypothetical protein